MLRINAKQESSLRDNVEKSESCNGQSGVQHSAFARSIAIFVMSSDTYNNVYANILKSRV